MFFLSDVNTIDFKRGRDKKKRKQKMSKLGAGLRIATSAAAGAGLGTLLAYGHGTRTKLITAGVTGAMLGGFGYIDHKNSPYSPVGKKKWKPFPDKHPMKKILFQDVRKIDN